ncbi:hypothetical protein BJ978_000735 [Agromyces terreus]|uniref:DUF998 domain-containing protein n=1 Tax=Agromyces terreus TaxID=424795 RepID=A0A9X2KAY3_9MICO|nr:hypothetical protein [Agromyces terreus]MCP2370059.1 hypothetical protein [Agromyces terreus]
MDARVFGGLRAVPVGATAASVVRSSRAFDASLRQRAARRREAGRRLASIRDGVAASVMRRVLVTLISLLLGVAVFQVFAPRFGSPIDAAWQDRQAGAILLGATAGVLVFVALGIASASGRGIALLHAIGVRSTPANRAALAAGSWFAVAALGVHFSAAAFLAVPGQQWGVAAVLGGGLAVAVFCLHRVAVHDHVYRTFNLAALLLASAAIASMGTTATGSWWDLNFSTLGTTDDVAAFYFNAGAVLSGLSMALLARTLTAGLAAPRFGAGPVRMRVLRGCIMAIGACLMGVGLVPIDTATSLHNAFALGAAVSFAVPALGLRLLVPGAPKRFVQLSFALVVVEVAAMGLYDGVRLVSLTVFEIVAFALIFVWLMSLTMTPREPGALRAGAADVAGLSLEAVHVAKRPVSGAEGRRGPGSGHPPAAWIDPHSGRCASRPARIRFEQPGDGPSPSESSCESGTDRDHFLWNASPSSVRVAR